MFWVRGPVAALFDGVGGNRGEVLMAPAIEAWARAMASPDASLRAGIDGVHSAVRNMVASDPKLRGGAVAVAALALRGLHAHLIRTAEIAALHRSSTGVERLEAVESLRGVRDGDRFFLLSPALACAVDDGDIEAAATLPTSATSAAHLMRMARSRQAGRQLSALVVSVRADGEHQASMNAEPMETGTARVA